MIGLCDCNNFFVSCQRVFRPDLNNKPVIVLSGNDGCVIARSNEVKALGIKMGIPLFKVRNIVENNDIHLFSANHKLYADMSSRVMENLRQLTPSIEIYSIDEAFIDFSGFETDKLKTEGERLAKTIKQNIGIPVSIGIAPTKTLAKIASQLCKNYPKLNGACLMYKKEDIEKVLRKTPIEDIWGIGYRTAKKLHSLGINTAFSFGSLNENTVRSIGNISLVRTWKELHGESIIEFSAHSSPHQSISIGRSFNKDITNFEELRSYTTIFASNLANKLRKQQACTTQITTYIYTNRYKKNNEQHFDSDTINLSIPTDSSIEIIKLVNDSLKKIYKPEFAYKKAGVICSHLSPKTCVNNVLFDTIDREKHSKIMKSIDDINAIHGKRSIVFASEFGNKLDHNKKFLSPNYTTEWDDIINVKP